MKIFLHALFEFFALGRSCKISGALADKKYWRHRAKTAPTIVATTVFLFSTLLLSACNPLAKFQTPEVQLSNIKVLERSGFEQLFLLQIRVTNPNKMALPIAGLHYSLRLNGFELFTGNATDLPALNAHSNTAIDLPVRANLINAGAILTSLLISETPDIKYQLDADFDLTGILPDFHIAKKGVVNLEH